MATESNKKDSVSVPDQSATGFDTGAFLPKDMTVRLVRADSAGWEIYLSVFWSITLTIFGIYLGAWISSGNQKATPLTITSGTGANTNTQDILVDLAQTTFGASSKFACVAFGVISLVLLGAWVVIKVRQSSSTLKVPYEMLQSCTDETNNG